MKDYRTWWRKKSINIYNYIYQWWMWECDICFKPRIRSTLQWDFIVEQLWAIKKGIA